MLRENKKMPTFQERYRNAAHEYDLEIDSSITHAFTTFRHRSKQDQDKILNQFREKFPKLYVLLLEIQRDDEDWEKYRAEQRQREIWELPNGLSMKDGVEG